MIRVRPAALSWLVLLGGGAWPCGARADEFDRLESKQLAVLTASADAKSHPSLTIGELDALPAVLRDSRSAFLIVRTGQGNLARLLVAPALRKPADGAGAPIPVLALERYETFEPGEGAARLARGKDVLLFAGFEFDLDSGQVVPEGQGGDLRFENPQPAGAAGARLTSRGEARIYSLTRPVPPPAVERSRPSLGRGVLPGDFAGRFRLFANGQWSGTLDLKVDEAGAVSGRFRSDLNGTTYPVSGQVAAEVPQQIRFSINYPRTRQDFEGLLWTEGKGAMAGTLTMLDRGYGFFALREGGSFAPEGEDVGPVSAKGDRKPGRRSVALRKGLYTLDGKPQTEQELIDALKRAVAADPATWVLLEVAADEPYSAVDTAFETLGAAGVAAVRLAPAASAP